jgi:hypothetical protein
MKTLNIRHAFADHGKYYPTSFFQKLYDTLLTQYPDYEFIIDNSPDYENHGQGSVYSCLNFSIINPDNKYILVSFFDNWRYHFMKHIGWQPELMTQFLYPGGFNYAEYFYFKHLERDNTDILCPSNINKIYQSFYYPTYNVSDEAYVSELYESRNIRTAIPELYFHGCLWDFRQTMMDGLDDSSIYVSDKHGKNLDYNLYLNYMSHYRCALSLPGGTEICNRDIECFSIGVPVIRPTLSINFEDPLIPNYHYISCYDNCKYWDGYPSYLSYKDFQESLKDCWSRVKNNLEYLEFVANNARQWYLRNCTIDNNIKYIISKIDLETLNG